jgi:chloride channel 3/4/5
MPMINVIEMFRRMGMRFCLVTQKGCLVGIITKKDVLQHMAELNHRETAKLNIHELANS